MHFRNLPMSGHVLQINWDPRLKLLPFQKYVLQKGSLKFLSDINIHDISRGKFKPCCNIWEKLSKQNAMYMYIHIHPIKYSLYIVYEHRMVGIPTLMTTRSGEISILGSNNEEANM